MLFAAMLAGGAFFWAYPAPGVIANGPAPMSSSAQDAAQCEEALLTDAKGLPDKAVPEARYRAARAVCDKALDSLEPGVRVIVEAQFTLPSPSILSAFRVQGLVVRRVDATDGVYIGVADVWVPANRIRVSPAKMTTEEEQAALWRRLVGKP